MNIRCVAVALVGATAFAGPAHAGLTFTTERTEDGQTTASTISFDADHLRAESTAARPGEPPRVLLFDGAKKTIFVLSPRDKTWFELNAAMRSKLQQQVGGMSDEVRASMAERMKSLPPAQRARVEAMMAQQQAAAGGAPGRAAATAPKPRDLHFTATGTKKTAGGQACEMYHVTDGGKPFEEDCLAKFGAGLMQKEDTVVFQKLAESFADFAGQGASPMHEYSRYPGFPMIRVRVASDGSKLSEETVKSVKRSTFAPELFAVPADYVKDARGPFGR